MYRRAAETARSWPLSRLLPHFWMFLPPFGGPVECAVPDATRQEFRHAFLAGVIIEAVGIALSDGPALIGDPGRKIVAARVADRDEAAIGIAGIDRKSTRLNSSH